ncbi:gp53-like domain-containing protein [Megamonas funiformis]|uniref:gp53-like domain-containing protein n=1 Tax=Megamonas funiformis TaxID=437897 RepID=UPI003B8A60F1
MFQWGDNTGQQSQYSKKIYSFPIPYKSNVFMIATEPKGYIGVKANKTAHSASVENLKQFSLYVGEYRNMYWFAIGN